MAELLLAPVTPTSPASPASPLRPPARTVDLASLWRGVLRRVMVVAVQAAVARLLFAVIKSAFFKGSPLRAWWVAVWDDAIASGNACKWAVLVGWMALYRAFHATLSRLAASFQASAFAGGSEAESDATAVKRAQRVASFLSGALAAAGAMVVMNDATRTELGLYAAVRAAHGALARHATRLFPGPASFRHWDLVVMCVSAIQINYCLMFEHGCLEPKYLSFLQACTVTDPRVLTTASALQRRIICPEMVAVARERGQALGPPDDLAQTCTYLHPEATCGAAAITYAVKNFTTIALPLQLWIRGATAIVNKPLASLRQPLHTLLSVVLSAARSSVFLTLLGLPPFSLICVFARSGLHCPWGIATAAGLLSGLTTAIEPKGRRLDLALYCSMQAFRSAVMLLYRRGHIRRPTRHHVTALALAAFGVLFYQYDHECDTLHPNVRKALAWVTGERHSRSPFPFSERPQRSGS